MEICVRCGVQEDRVRLFDAIYEGRMDVICERCSIIENIPIIKKPDSSQLKESEETKVYDRMKKLAGIKKPRCEETYFQEDKIKELDEHPELEKPEKEKLNLIDYFHWEVMKNRRRKGFSPQQLAKTLGESEIALQMIEKGKLPENPESLIRKLEQFFQIKLRNIPETEKILQKKLTQPTLFDEDGFELDIIPEEEPYIPPKEDEEIVEEAISDKSEIKCRIEQFQPEKRRMIHESGQEQMPSFDIKKDFDLKKIDTRSVTIEQLKQLHEKKKEQLRQEEEKEKRKQEERKRILDELREKDRIKREQVRQTVLLEKQKQEHEKLKIIKQKKQEIELRRKKEADEIDRFLGGSELLENKPEYDHDFEEV